MMLSCAGFDSLCNATDEICVGMTCEPPATTGQACIAYWTAEAPWINWMVQDFALKALLAFAFLGVYRLLRKGLRPRGGFGG